MGLSPLIIFAWVLFGIGIFFIFGPYVFKKIGEWFTIGASIGGLKVLQKINKVKGEKHEKEDEKVRKQSSREQ